MSPGEQFVWAKIQAGHLELRGEEVWYFHCRRQRWYPKVCDACPKTGRGRFRFGPTRSTVFRNRLVWMLVNRQVIPEGHVVDHRDQDCKNDRPDNLELMTYKKSHQQGNQLQADRQLDYLSRWFAFVGEHHREPQTPMEESFVEVGF